MLPFVIHGYFISFALFIMNLIKYSSFESMQTIILFLIFIASYIWYNTSTKVKVKTNFLFLQKLVKEPKQAKLVSAIIYATAYGLLLIKLPYSTAFFYFIVYLMAVMSLVVLLVPYKYIKSSGLIFLFLLITISEFLLSK